MLENRPPTFCYGTVNGKKLKYYGISKSALNLIQNYLSNRKKCVKLGTTLSTWQDIYKGVPQGSFLGPVLFNIFINDKFYFISDSSLYNYADDNTLSYSGYDLDRIINTLEKDSLNLIDWFTSNQMKVNPDKFQVIAIGKNTQSKDISFNLIVNIIKTEDDCSLE